MGWSIGGPDERGRAVGYGVPAYCDHPGCDEEIDRGLGHVCCNQQPFGGEDGCGLYFCEKHSDAAGMCERCAANVEVWKRDQLAKLEPSFEPKREHPKWVFHLLNHDSWARWRNENSGAVKKLRALAKADEAAGLKFRHVNDGRDIEQVSA